jgi:hypothetical protein
VVSKHRARAILLIVAAAVLLLLPAAPASAAAIVLHPGDIPDCTFEPGDVPGVDVFFPAACTVVTSASGEVNIVARGQLPEGYTLTQTFVGTLPCFGDTGRVVATKSGQVTATCHFPGG